MTDVIRDLSDNEIEAVSGGFLTPGSSIGLELEKRFPRGEWHNGSFFPYGVPKFVD